MTSAWLEDVDRTKQVKTHGSLKASYIVLHNTMGGRVTSSIDHLNNHTNGFGYHILIERNGSVFQTAALDRITRHAGLSNWRGWDSLNSFSVGISLANYGPLRYRKTHYENEYGRRMPDDSALPGPVPHYNGARNYEIASWERYPAAQVDACLRICREIVDRMSIRDIVRHDDVSIGRKFDTGPALSLSPFSKLVGDRSAELVNTWKVVTPNDTLTVRAHHSRHGKPLGTLPDKTEVYVLSKSYQWISNRWRIGKWWLISLDGLERTGFVHSDFLEFAEPYA
ncbi:N-acetylmuramoyl-L-alanine amidase [Pararhodobacter sp. SW119]|uniref:N-acetylmuramoyl-L-alanine amidase n=1 Tax=Pararhodobacter sp. SW119 TaxID=2780075 RepID=UPI001ADEC144|nr:N-acetylmuramoyl-L-alanine amidase [Pararhodobacter sp. SW119]